MGKHIIYTRTASDNDDELRNQIATLAFYAHSMGIDSEDIFLVTVKGNAKQFFKYIEEAYNKAEIEAIHIVDISRLSRSNNILTEILHWMYCNGIDLYVNGKLQTQPKLSAFLGVSNGN